MNYLEEFQLMSSKKRENNAKKDWAEAAARGVRTPQRLNLLPTWKVLVSNIATKQYGAQKSPNYPRFVLLSNGERVNTESWEVDSRIHTFSCTMIYINHISVLIIKRNHNNQSLKKNNFSSKIIKNILFFY